jgi:hypothetical protein
MAQQPQIVADGFEHRILATCRRCGDAIWYLDLEHTSADHQISCGAYGDRGA